MNATSDGVTITTTADSGTVRTVPATEVKARRHAI